MGCSGNCYPLFLIAFNINPPIIAIGMETESETGSRNAPNIPPKIVQTTARAIISGLHNFQNIFSAAKSYVVQHEFVFDWIKISIAHLFGLEKRKEKGTADFRCSFCIYASKTISRVLYLTVIYLDVPLPVRSSHPGSGRASLGTRSPCSHTGVAPDRVYSDGCFDAPSGELLPRLSTLTTSSQASYPSPRRDTARLTHFAVPPFP